LDDTDAPRRISCGTHGEVGPAFVCGHLLRDRSTALGFNPATPEPGEEPQAWCDDCDRAVLAAGDWTPELEERADIRLICEFCFETLRQIHQRAR